jgi:predicted nucleic acid-binding Zn ribbon protein
VDCLNCQIIIPNPKKGQKFCSSKCRYASHDKVKTKEFTEDFLNLLKKYRLLDRAIELNSGRGAGGTEAKAGPPNRAERQDVPKPAPRGFEEYEDLSQR